MGSTNATAAKPQDKFGRPILAGDYVAYPVHQCDSALLRVGRVLKVSGKTVTVRGVDDYSGEPELLSKPGTLRFPERIVVLDWERVPPAYYRLLCNLL